MSAALHRPLSGRRAFLPLVALAVFPLLAAGCGGAPQAFGAPVDAGSAVPLSTLLPGVDLRRDREVVVEARLAEVCPTAGCWCILEDEGGRLYVTLATFVLPRSVEGRRCRVAGRLVLQDDRPTLLATGLEVLSD